MLCARARWLGGSHATGMAETVLAATLPEPTVLHAALVGARSDSIAGPFRAVTAVESTVLHAAIGIPLIACSLWSAGTLRPLAVREATVAAARCTDARFTLRPGAAGRLDTSRTQPLDVIARRPGRHDRTMLELGGRPSAAPLVRHEALGRRSHAELAVQRSEVVVIADAARSPAAAEVVLVEPHHGIAHAEVLEVGHVVHVDEPRVVDDHVVDDARAAPAAPVRSSHEPAAAPPRNHRLAEAERAPAHERRADAHRDADARRTEEGDEGGRIHRLPR